MQLFSGGRTLRDFETCPLSNNRAWQECRRGIGEDGTLATGALNEPDFDRPPRVGCSCPRCRLHDYPAHTLCDQRIIGFRLRPAVKPDIGIHLYRRMGAGGKCFKVLVSAVEESTAAAAIDFAYVFWPLGWDPQPVTHAGQRTASW